MMKVSMVSTIIPETHYSRFLISAFQRDLGDEVEMLVYADKNRKNRDVPLKNIKLVWSQSFLYPLEIIRRAVKDRPDVIHLQHEINMYGGPLKAALFPFLILFLRLFGFKIIITIHAVVPKKQIDLEFLDTFYLPRSKVLLKLVRMGFSFLYTFTARFASTLVVHSNFMSSILVDDYGTDGSKIFVVPHGVPEKKDVKSGELKKKELQKSLKNKRVVLYFGYLVKRKGIEYLIEAFERVSKNHPDYVLVLGGGELEYQKEYVGKLKNMVHNKRLEEKIIFTSFLSELELNKLFQISELVVLPSVYSISASGPLAISIFHRKPIVASDIGVFREEIENEKDGLLCEPRSSKALEDAINRLIEDSSLRQELSEGLDMKAKARSWSEISKKTYELYKRI